MSTVSPSSEQQLDRAALAALYEETFKNLEEGTSAWEVEYAKVLEKIKTKHGLKE